MNKIIFLKKIFLVAMAIAITVIAASCNQTPSEETNEENVQLKYVSNRDGTCYVSGIDNKDADKVVIPDTSPNGDRVIGIGGQAFRGCKKLAEIIIPDSVQFIKDGAFSECNNLIKIENNLSYVDNWVIDCDDSITEAIIKGDCVGVADSAFKDCDNLMSITIGAEVKNIGELAFDGCKKLVEIYNLSPIALKAGSREHGGAGYYARVINESASVPSGLFTTAEGFILLDSDNGCYLVGYNGFGTNLSLPANCRGKNYAINDYAFLNQQSIISVSIPETVTDIGRFAFEGCISLKEINIPTGVSEIGEQAFALCTALETVRFSEGLKKVNYRAFYGCSSLSEAILPDTTTEICDSAFAGCKSLSNVVVGNGVTTIGPWAFSSCTELMTLTIGASMEKIDYAAFSSCFRLVEVYNLSSLDIKAGGSDHGYAGLYALNIYNNTTTQSKQWIDDNGFIFYQTGKTCYLTGYVGESSHLTLPDNCNGKNYAINKYAFDNSEYLVRVVIPEGVTEIGEYAFFYCQNLKEIVIAKSVKTINSYAFEDCPWFSVYYCGNSTNWKSVKVKQNNSVFTNSSRYYYSESAPSSAGNYWHYVDNNPVIWE